MGTRHGAPRCSPELCAIAGEGHMPLTWSTVLTCEAALSQDDLKPVTRMAKVMLERCHAAAHGGWMSLCASDNGPGLGPLAIHGWEMRQEEDATAQSSV